jgi:hypothetical protein
VCRQFSNRINFTPDQGLGGIDLQLKSGQGLSKVNMAVFVIRAPHDQCVVKGTQGFETVTSIFLLMAGSKIDDGYAYFLFPFTWLAKMAS